MLELIIFCINLSTTTIITFRVTKTHLGLYYHLINIKTNIWNKCATSSVIYPSYLNSFV